MNELNRLIREKRLSLRAYSQASGPIVVRVIPPGVVTANEAVILARQVKAAWPGANVKIDNRYADTAEVK